MRKIIFSAILLFISILTYAQKYEKLYNKGIKLFEDEKFKEADSLFSLAIIKSPKNYRNPVIYYDRGVTRLYLSDTCGFCSDMKAAADLNDLIARNNYKIHCLKCNNEAKNYYNRGYHEFLQKNFRLSDSLLTLSIESHAFVDNIFQRGIVRLYMLDTAGFCSDMATISNLNEKANQNYQNICQTNKSIIYVQQECNCRRGDEYDNDVFFVVENMPKFDGKNSDAFRVFIQKNLKYPIEAMEKGITGRVFVQFDICKNGELKNAKIVRSAGEILDNEALRVLSLSPKWSPGLQRNKPVVVRYTFPIVFQMN